MVKMIVVKDWIFEREGRGKGPSLKEGDKIDVEIDFAKKLIKREVAEVADRDAKGDFKSFPPPVSSSQSTKVDAQMEKLKAVTGGASDDAASNTVQKPSDNNTTNVRSGSGNSSSGKGS